MPTASGTSVPQRASGRLSGALPLVVIGWREVFIPLVVVLHNQHGPTLAIAGLAVAASRVGGWLYAKGSLHRPPYEAAVLGGIALLLLGLTPEEGPVGLLLWFVFGVTWPILLEALAARVWQGWAAAFVLLAGMTLAGPLAAGPGTWLIAGCFLLLAWRGNLAKTASPVHPASAPEPRSVKPASSQALPFLFGFADLMWIWLAPTLLIGLSLPASSFGVLLSASWLARLAGAWAARRLSGRKPLVAAALGLPLAIAAIAFASAAWQLVAGFILYGVLMGWAGARPVIQPPELARLPGRAQALGEVLGPLAGVAVYVLGGSIALFGGAALASLALGAQLWSDVSDVSST
jgi:hypothetical protein